MYDVATRRKEESTTTAILSVKGSTKMTRKARHQIQQKSFKNLMFQTNLMREESFLTDFQLICEDKEFLVHKVILSAASPYFKEYFKRNSQTTSLQMDFMNSKTLDTVLIFIYQGRVDLRNQSQPFLKDLLEAFIRLHIPLISIYCLEQFLGTEQFLSQWNVIEQLNSDLIQQMYMEYLHKNIKTLKTTEFFLNLRFEQLNALLNCSVSSPVNQEELISSILLWVKHDQSTRINRITDLLTTIDFNRSLLLKFINEPLLEDNLFFNKQWRKIFSNELVNDKKSESITSKERKIKNETKVLNSRKEKKTQEKKRSLQETQCEEQNKCICQGQSKEKSEEIKVPSSENISKNQRRSFVSKRILIYDYVNTKRFFECNPNSETLTEVKDQFLINFFSSRGKYSAVCGFDNFIYTFGGQFSNRRTNKCFMMDLLENKFLEINPMSKYLDYPVAVKLHQFIYVIGMENDLNSCEKYNLTTQSWEPMANNPYEYYFNCDSFFSVDDRLCLIGVTHLLWYDPQTDQWSQGDQLPDNLQCQYYPSATYINGKIFLVFFGSNDVYCFDLKMKTWNTFCSPDHSRNYFISITCLKESDSVDFLIGGQGVKSFIFRPPNNWKCISTDPFGHPRVISVGE